MTRKLPTAKGLDHLLSGLTNEETGHFGAHAAQGRWSRPSEIWISTIGGQDAIFYRWPVLSEEGLEDVEADSGLFKAFLAMAERGTGAESVLSFAKRWGVFRFCRHGAPYRHPNHFWPVFHAPVVFGCQPSSPRICEPLSAFGAPEDVFCEPVDLWFMWARRANALLKLGKALDAGKPPEPAAWSEALEPCERPERLFAWYTSGLRPLARLAFMADYWLAVDPVTACLSGRYIANRPSSRPKLGLSHRDLFGAIAVQLSLALCAGTHYGTCTACGRLHERRRKPREDRRVFCPECSAGGEPQKWAQRDYRQKQRTAGKPTRIHRRKGSGPAPGARKK